jgi:UDP-N-acetyl-D-mannosaminuronic acid transferase (WecB/TagA/CpsF family)
MNRAVFDYITFCGVHIHTVRADSVINGILETITSSGRMLIAGTNADLTNLSYKESWLREFMNSCDIVFCDGIAVKWGRNCSAPRYLRESLFPIGSISSWLRPRSTVSAFSCSEPQTRW